MTTNIDNPEPEIYVVAAGPGKFQQAVRTLSAAVAAAALLWGVLWIGDESMKQTDLMNEQTELIREHWDYTSCTELTMASIARVQVMATAFGAEGTGGTWRGNTNDYMTGLVELCFPNERFNNE